MDDITHRYLFKIMIAVAALFMVFIWRFMKLHPGKRFGAITFDLVLLALAVASVAAYFEFGWLRYGQYMNPHDVYHYYIGAKYSQEHQYYDLYRVSLVADKETKGLYTQKIVRDLRTHRYEPVTAVMQKKDEYKALFTPERWEEFKKDIAYFQSVMPAYKWNVVLRDKGYNATPVWNAVARGLTNLAPTSSVWAMRALTYIDLALLVLTFLAIWAAFGRRAMLVSIIFYGTLYFMAYVHIKGAFMRLDWFACLVIATCLLKLRCYKTAGALMAYAAAARVFPAIFCFALGIKLLIHLFHYLRDRMRKSPDPVVLNRAYFGFFLTFACVGLGLVAATAAVDGGFQLWQNFFEKISIHNTDISTNRAGFKYVFLWPYGQTAANFVAHQGLWKTFMAIALFLTALGARRVEDYETIALSFVPVFFLTAPTFYYFVMLLVPLLLFLPKIERASHAFGAALFFTLSIFGYCCSFWMTHNFPLFFLLSSGMLILCAYMLFVTICLPGAALASASGAPVLPKGSRRDEGNSGRILGILGGVLALLAFCALLLSGAPSRRETSEEIPQATIPKAAPRVATVTPVPDTAPGVELVFVGDIMLSRNVAASIKEKNRDFTYPFLTTRDYVQSADIAFGNLECPVSGRGEALKGKNYLFNAPPESMIGPSDAGFDVLSLANNHVLDYGTVALADTIRLVEEGKINGIGLTVNDAPQTPFIQEVKGIKIGFLAYCDPVSPYGYAKEFYSFDMRPAKADKPTLDRDIAALKTQVDAVVVSIHWGIEYRPEPDAHQRDLAHFVIDQGARILAGHHPHVQHEAELYNGGLILYSMGNFVFDQYSRPPTRVSRLYRVKVDKEGVTYADYIPLAIPLGDWQPRRTSQDIVTVLGPQAKAALG